MTNPHKKRLSSYEGFFLCPGLIEKVRVLNYECAFKTLAFHKRAC